MARKNKKKAFSFKSNLTPGAYRKHAIKVFGAEEGNKKADAYQKKYYESMSGAGSKKGSGAKMAKEAQAIEKETSRKGFKPVSASEYLKKTKAKKKKKKKDEWTGRHVYH